MEDEEEIIKVEDSHGVIRHFKGAFAYHRADGPAVIYPNGDCSWYYNDRLHREDGPAREWPAEGIFEWWKDGELYEPTAHEIITWKMMKKKE